MRIAPAIGVGLVCLLALSGGSDAADRPVVTITAGGLQGSLATDGPGASFKAIPFAATPVGVLRWHEPMPAKPWAGVKDASAYGPMCIQMGRQGPAGSEDCLTLNVWTPEWPLKGTHPVMLWIYGGGNTAGTASRHDGAALARRGVVVVAANYRVGVMGFLAHPELSAESGHKASGNYALLDQIAALRWVKDNIAKFGGDPGNVTVFGQSAGAYDILLLMSSPLAKGLFQHAIAESGQILSYDGPMPKARAEGMGMKLAAALKAPEGNSLAYLRNLPAEQVVAVSDKLMPTDLDSDTGLLTTIDGWVLPDSPARIFASAKEMPVPLIIGNNSREITPKLSLDALKEKIAAKYGDLAPKAFEAYGISGSATGHDDPLLGGVGAQWMTDSVQRCAAIMEAGWHAAAGHPTFEYQFEHPVPGRTTAGAAHSAELPFLFAELDGDRVDAPATPADHKASDDIQTYWTRFAATGDPNGGGAPVWPRAGSGRYLAFAATGPVAKSDLEAAPCAVFREWALRRMAR